MTSSKYLTFFIASLSLLMIPEIVMGQRGTLNIPIPAVEADLVGAGQQIWIRTVTDARSYQDRPSTPDVPSMGVGLARSTDDERARAVGRERDGFGRARRNVFLPRNKTVATLVTELLENIFTNLGYTVVLDDDGLEGNALILDATVNKFWGWVDVDAAGAWTGSVRPTKLEGEIQTHINIQAGDNTRQFHISGRASHNIFAGLTRRNWLRTYELFLQDYIQNFRSAFKQTLK